MVKENKNLENYGDQFQNKSKYTRENLPRHRLDWSNKPDTYKIYNNPIEVIDLPKPDFPINTDFWEIIRNRHSTRKFSQKSLNLEKLGLLIYGISGINRNLPHFEFRTVPSAGGLYPIETYLIVNNVSNLERGVYHYQIQNHMLEYIKQGDFKKKASEACLGQAIAYHSAVNFVWTAMIERSKWKYLQRCYRYIYLDAGHIGQNLYLVGEALNLGVCTIGAIFDDELNNILDIDGKKETAIYVGVVGTKTN
jgi:SagB-type dehydrogenase family enzyme